MSSIDPALLKDVSASETPLRTTFRIRVNGQPVSIGTVGQAFRFITSLSAVEWMEFRALHEDALLSLQRAADNAMLTVQATNRAAHAVCTREAAVKCSPLQR